MGLNQTESKRQEVTLSEFRDRLPDLIARILYRGEEFVITRQGQPVAMLVGIDKPSETDASSDFPREGAC